jgi:hypothetical protein
MARVHVARQLRAGRVAQQRRGRTVRGVAVQAQDLDPRAKRLPRNAATRNLFEG